MRAVVYQGLAPPGKSAYLDWDVARWWDAVAALHTPTNLDDWEPCFDDQGHEIDWLAKTRRRDEFLREALDRLD